MNEYTTDQLVQFIREKHDGLRARLCRVNHDHCWHCIHALTVNPPIMVYRCCHCGDERKEETRPLHEPCGKFAP